MAPLITFDQETLSLLKTFPTIFDNDKSLYEYRKLTKKRFLTIIKKNLIDVSEIINNPKKFIAIMNTLHIFDVSLAIKTGVHFGLFGSNLLRFGSDEQIKRYVTKINTGKILGSLAITESGHGSNIKDLETIAKFDAVTQTFTIHSPTPSSVKCWIGNVNDCTHTIIFARLIVNNFDHGVYPFIIKIRDVHHNLLWGVQVTDLGHKKGLNGVDNGTIEFNNFQVSIKALLTKFGKIDVDANTFVAAGSNNFSNILSTLSGGRGILAHGSNAVAALSLSIAIKYAYERRQFKENQHDKIAKEIPIINYSTHNTVLFTHFVKTAAIQLYLNIMTEKMMFEYKKMDVVTKKMHIVSTIMKIICSENAEKVCGDCRFLCGGNGYRTVNKICQLHSDIDVYRTFEGDNTVIKQELGKYVVTKYMNINLVKDQTIHTVVSDNGNNNNDNNDGNNYNSDDVNTINNIINTTNENINKSTITEFKTLARFIDDLKNCLIINVKKYVDLLSNNLPVNFDSYNENLLFLIKIVDLYMMYKIFKCFVMHTEHTNKTIKDFRALLICHIVKTHIELLKEVSYNHKDLDNINYIIVKKSKAILDDYHNVRIYASFGIPYDFTTVAMVRDLNKCLVKIASPLSKL